MSSYKIDTLEGIGASHAQKLAAAGATTTGKLLDKCATPKGRKDMVEATGLSDKLILRWANMADLMRVKGVGEEYSELLEAAGVDTVKELRTRRAENLAAALKNANARRKLVRQVPAESQVARWIAHSKTLMPKLKH